MHSMKMRTETSEEAIAKTNNFINELIQDARIAVERYEQGYNSLDWTCDFIIKQIGHASHTIQDRLCPQHFEDGQPKTWYTGWYFALNAVHIPKLFTSPPSSAKNVFNNWIRSTMAQVIQGNSNIIKQLFE